jgi:hypothetical protein
MIIGSLVGVLAQILVGWAPNLPLSSPEIVWAASCSSGAARSAKDWSTRETGPETEMAAGVGALGMARSA